MSASSMCANVMFRITSSKSGIQKCRSSNSGGSATGFTLITTVPVCVGVV